MQSIIDNYQALLCRQSGGHIAEQLVSTRRRKCGQRLLQADADLRVLLGPGAGTPPAQMATTVMTAVQGKTQSVAANLKMVDTLRVAVAGQRDGFDAFWRSTLNLGGAGYAARNRCARSGRFSLFPIM